MDHIVYTAEEFLHDRNDASREENTTVVTQTAVQALGGLKPAFPVETTPRWNFDASHPIVLLPNTYAVTKGT
jgi:hypothetical protein